MKKQFARQRYAMIKQTVSERGYFFTAVVNAKRQQLTKHAKIWLQTLLQMMHKITRQKLPQRKHVFFGCLALIMHVFDATQVATALQICQLKNNVANRHVHVGWIFPFKTLTSKHVICLDWHFPKNVMMYFQACDFSYKSVFNIHLPLVNMFFVVCFHQPWLVCHDWGNQCGESTRNRH